MTIKQKLKQHIDKEYLLFHSKLVNSKYPLEGVRVPIIKKLAKEETYDIDELKSFQPETYEEVMAFGFMIAYAKTDLKNKLLLIDHFINFIDNWAVCDSFVMALKIKKQDLDLVWNYFLKLHKAKEEFSRRFFVVLLMSKFLHENYIDEVISLFLTIEKGDYFVDMAISWAFATAMAKFPEKTIMVIKQKSLPKFIQNKAIQKMRESYRITDDLKTELNNYRIKE